MTRRRKKEGEKPPGEAKAEGLLSSDSPQNQGEEDQAIEPPAGEQDALGSGSSVPGIEGEQDIDQAIAEALEKPPHFETEHLKTGTFPTQESSYTRVEIEDPAVALQRAIEESFKTLFQASVLQTLGQKGSQEDRKETPEGERTTDQGRDSSS